METRGRPQVPMLDPAASIIEALGGIEAVALVIKRSRWTVWRWTQPKSKGGHDGRVPDDYQQILLDYARKKKLPVTAESFFRRVA